MSDLCNQAIQYAHEHQKVFVEKLMNFISIPTISNSSEHKMDMYRATDWLVAYLKSIGIEKAEVFQTNKHPIVFAENVHNKDVPTVLIYGHYDVQPPDPLDQWASDPFKPVIRDQCLFGRGASDMKDKYLLLLLALKRCLIQEICL